MFEELKDKEKENPSSVNTYWEKWENLVSKRGRKDNQILSFFKRYKVIFTTDADTEKNERTDILLIINWIARFQWYEDQEFADMLPELIPFMEQEKNLLTREMAAFLIQTIQIKFHGLKNIT